VTVLPQVGPTSAVATPGGREPTASLALCVPATRILLPATHRTAWTPASLGLTAHGAGAAFR
jgi:hypothetical protein